MKASPFFTIALNVSLLTSLLAQTPPQQPSRPSTPGEDEVVRVTTNLVQIDAVVTDKNGKPVTDLRPEDFEILEDNKLQPITAFSYVSTDSNAVASANPPAMPIKNAPPLPPIPLRPEQVRRTIVFVVDDLGLSLSSFNAVQSGLKKYVAEQMQPGDLVAVVRTGGGAGALQQLTADKHQLRDNIDHLRWSCRNRVGTSPLGVLDPVSALKAGQCAPVPDLKDTVKALIYVVEGLKALPGRKSMLFFTDSFDVLKDNELVNRSGLTKPTPDINRLDEQIEQMMQGGGGEGVGSYSGDAKGLVRRLIDESNTASTVIYSVDARGLLVAGPTAQDSDESIFSVKNRTNLLDQRREDVWETQTGLAYLAHATSGFTILNNNDLGRGMERIMNDLKGYYLIGYRPADATFAKQKGTVPYHKLTLRMLRPGLNVRSRKGFYGTTASVVTNGGPRTKEQRMAEAVDSPFAAGGVHLRLTTLFGNVQQGSFVRTLLHVDARDLTFKEMPDGWHQADIDVIASSYGENGLIADYLARSETIRARGKTYANLLSYGLNYNLLVPIKKPGSYQLRAAVRDAPTDRVGSAYQFIEVPDLKKGRLALSGIAVSSVVLDLSSLSSDSAVYNAPSDNGEQAQPTSAVRRFKPGMLLDYRYVIYNALPGPRDSLPELTAQVRLFRDGELVTSSDERASDTSRLQFDPKRLSAKGSLRLGDELIPGNYVLQILVTDPRAKGQASMASQWIDFEVVK